jgi:hypothetical protein
MAQPRRASAGMAWAPLAGSRRDRVSIKIRTPPPHPPIPLPRSQALDITLPHFRFPLSFSYFLAGNRSRFVILSVCFSPYRSFSRQHQQHNALTHPPPHCLCSLAMHSSIWLLCVAALGVSAHPLVPRNNHPWSPVERDYYTAVAERISLAERSPDFPDLLGSCDLSKATLPECESSPYYPTPRGDTSVLIAGFHSDTASSRQWPCINACCNRPGNPKLHLRRQH